MDEDNIIIDPYDALTDEELDEMYESWLADEYLSSQEYHDRNYIDGML